jgi:hypothetical protein
VSRWIFRTVLCFFVSQMTLYIAPLPGTHGTHCSSRVAESKISERQEFLERRLKVNPPLGRIQAAARVFDD